MGKKIIKASKEERKSSKFRSNQDLRNLIRRSINREKLHLKTTDEEEMLDFSSSLIIPLIPKTQNVKAPLSPTVKMKPIHLFSEKDLPQLREKLGTSKNYSQASQIPRIEVDEQAGIPEVPKVCSQHKMFKTYHK